MQSVEINGVEINYLVKGSGPNLLLFAPGGFNSVMSNWTKEGKNAWKEMDGLEALSKHFTLIAYDRREAGLSGGRVQALTWDVYADEAKVLLDHLKIKRASILGGCMGASLATVFASRYPEMCNALYLHWPVGGYQWMQRGQLLFNRHIEFVLSSGLAAVAERAKQKANFWADPETGPWATVLSRDAAFAATYVHLGVPAYLDMISKTRDNLFNDTMPSGASGKELMSLDFPTLIMSGKDEAHTVSCSWALHELIANSERWAVLPPDQNGSNTLDEILRFKTKHIQAMSAS